MVTKPSAEQTQDFSIHNEDFPALPGPNYKDTTLNNDESKTVSVSQWTLALHPPPPFWKYLKKGCASSKLFRFVFFVCRTWTPQARARPAQTGPSSPETKLPQHRTTTRRKGSRCCLMVRPLCQSYHSSPIETSLPIHTRWVRQFGSTLNLMLNGEKTISVWCISNDWNDCISAPDDVIA